MITFNYSDPRGQASVEFRCRAEHLNGIVEDFKKFLHHVGFHADNVAAVTYDIDEPRQAVPVQLDMFADKQSPNYAGSKL